MGLAAEAEMDEVTCDRCVEKVDRYEAVLDFGCAPLAAKLFGKNLV
jgi:hypothetical protein